MDSLHTNSQMTPNIATQLAHPAKRYAGQFIDLLISLGLFAAGLYIIQLVIEKNDAAVITVVAIAFSYFVFSDALPNGQSIGKKILGMSVISKSTGKPCTVLQSFARNVLTPFLGLVDSVFILRKDRQRLGDKMANTVVIDL